MESIIVKPDEINQLVIESGKLVFKPEAEAELIKLLELQEKIDEAVKTVKQTIAEAGESILPEFTGVQGSKIKCIYRAYGSKYGLDKDQPDLNEKFYKTSTRLNADAKAIEDHMKETGKTPSGVFENPRTKTLSISFIKQKKIEDVKS